jgi:hypothetical protein
MDVDAYVEALEAMSLWTDAIALVARALPVRVAIAWACRCDRDVPGVEDDPRHAALVAAAERWVDEPGEASQAAALELARAKPDGSAGQMLGMAAGLSDGTIRIGKNPPVEVPADTVPAMIAGAVMIAAGRAAPDVEEVFRRFLRLGVDIAAGGLERTRGDAGASEAR